MVQIIGPTVPNNPARPARPKSQTGTSEVSVSRHLPQHQPPPAKKDRRKNGERRAPGQGRRPLMDLRSGQDRRRSEDSGGVDVTA
ncbi:hypothetical protein HBA55_16285 [Pseudomaricurvus alkylphenolicus]|jgi:hypothetical protein|uniref:hypothetical protein n=1 Tax=Pseudomaricurvus alkylphenolicus TaxID=1306991 RepID=UPI00141F05FA|nr:hypothetical protein [Pseudomaricurvus alkylphenolicus]NIB41163.1 hypothetical protein [Pseudomaricurvus alkylphenolicus]